VDLIESTILLLDSQLVDLGHDVICHARVGVLVGVDVVAYGGGVGVLVVAIIACIEALIAVQSRVTRLLAHLALDFVTTATSTTMTTATATTEAAMKTTIATTTYRTAATATATTKSSISTDLLMFLLSFNTCFCLEELRKRLLSI
jgi:hypothetical protein